MIILYLPAKKPGSTSEPDSEIELAAMDLSSSIALSRLGTSSSSAPTSISGLASSPEKKVPSKARPALWMPAVGDFRPQAKPDSSPLVIFLALLTRSSQVHGASAVGSAIPADSRALVFTNTAYTWAIVGTPAILPSTVTDFHTDSGTSDLSSLGTSGPRSAR